MVEKQEDRFDLWILFIKNNYLNYLFEETSFLTFKLDLIIFPTIYYGPKFDKKWASKLALKNLPKEPCGQNPNRKFEKRQNVIFKPPGLLVRKGLILRVLKLYKYYLLSHKLEIFWRRLKGASLFFLFSILFIYFFFSFMYILSVLVLG